MSSANPASLDHSLPFSTPTRSGGLPSVYVRAEERSSSLFQRAINQCRSMFNSATSTGVVRDETNTGLLALNAKKQLSNGSVSEYGHYLMDLAQERGGVDFAILTGFLSESQGSFSDDLLKSDKKLIAIPLVLEGVFRDHIVCLLVDTGRSGLEFYDPKGLSLEERGDESLLSVEKESLSSLVERIKKQYNFSQQTTVVSNPYIHQKDIHNCGVYICDYLTRRLLNGSFDFKLALSTEAAETSAREEIMDALKSRQRDSSQNEPSLEGSCTFPSSEEEEKRG